VLILINKGFLSLVDLIAVIVTGSGFAKIMLVLSRWSFELMVIALMFLMNVVISINSRKSEFRADRYAFELGYGEELVEAFYVLDKIYVGGEKKLTKKMTASHPRLTARIEKLEDLLDSQEAIQTDPLPLNE